MVVVFGIAYAVGFRSSATLTDWLGAAGMLAFITFTLAWLGLAFGLAAKTVASASNGPFPLILLPLVGSGIVPTSTMPAGLRYFAQYQPFSPMTNTLRGLPSPGAPGSACSAWPGQSACSTAATASAAPPVQAHPEPRHSKTPRPDPAGRRGLRGGRVTLSPDRPSRIGCVSVA